MQQHTTTETQLNDSDLSNRTGAYNDRPFEIGTASDLSYWKAKAQQAQAFMNARADLPRTLIEIAAQHPLIDGEFPGEEFEKRLLLGKQLFDQELQKGRYVEIYVPGSRHVHNEVADNLALSTAGINYLLSIGVERNHLHGDDLNKHYKGDRGVYGSADECFVASSYFKDENFGRLLSVLSPVQMYRKTLHYIEFGILPLNYTAPTSETFHNWIDEIFSAVPRVLFSDPDLQSENSKWANSLRESRMPKLT